MLSFVLYGNENCQVVQVLFLHSTVAETARKLTNQSVPQISIISFCKILSHIFYPRSTFFFAGQLSVFQ